MTSACLPCNVSAIPAMFLFSYSVFLVSFRASPLLGEREDVERDLARRIRSALAMMLMTNMMLLCSANVHSFLGIAARREGVISNIKRRRLSELGTALEAHFAARGELRAGSNKPPCPDARQVCTASGAAMFLGHANCYSRA